MVVPQSFLACKSCELIPPFCFCLYKRSMLSSSTLFDGTINPCSFFSRATQIWRCRLVPSRCPQLLYLKLSFRGFYPFFGHSGPLPLSTLLASERMPRELLRVCRTPLRGPSQIHFLSAAPDMLGAVRPAIHFSPFINPLCHPPLKGPLISFPFSA